MKQHSPDQQRTPDLAQAPQHGSGARGSGFGLGNANMQDRLRFITDLQGWMSSQEAVLEDLQGEDRTG